MLVFGVRHYLIQSAVDAGGLEQGELGMNQAVPVWVNQSRVLDSVKMLSMRNVEMDAEGEEDFLMSAHLIWMKTCRNTQITLIVI